MGLSFLRSSWINRLHAAGSVHLCKVTKRQVSKKQSTNSKRNKRVNVWYPLMICLLSLFTRLLRRRSTTTTRRTTLPCILKRLWALKMSTNLIQRCFLFFNISNQKSKKTETCDWFGLLLELEPPWTPNPKGLEEVLFCCCWSLDDCVPKPKGLLGLVCCGWRYLHLSPYLQLQETTQPMNQTSWKREEEERCKRSIIPALLKVSAQLLSHTRLLPTKCTSFCYKSLFKETS